MAKFYKKGSIQNKEDIRFYNLHKKEIDKAFKRVYNSFVFDFDCVYSNTGNIKSAVRIRHDGMFSTYSIIITKKIKKAKNRYVVSSKEKWHEYVETQSLGSYDTFEEAIKAVKYNITIDELRNESKDFKNVLYNKEITKQIFDEVLDG